MRGPCNLHKPTMASLVLVLFALPLTQGCDTAEAIAADTAHKPSPHDGENSFFLPKSLRNAPVTLLPQNKGNESPACLDGSPYGFFFNPSKTNSTKWTISIEGGGWCYDEQLCYNRSKTKLGSSKYFPATAGCACMNSDDGEGLETDCNCLYMPYCDGASFSGYRPETRAVPGVPGAEITFRGIRNLDAVLDWAFENGLRDATQFVLTGGSAGGLSTFLHADRVAARVRTEAPKCKKIVAAPVVGYFLDHGNFLNTTGTPNTPSWKNATYTTWMRYIYQMQNLTFGTDGGLTEACQKEFPNDPGLCFMSPHMQNTIQTPFYIFNSKFDAWQLNNIFQSPFVTKSEQQGVLQYGKVNPLLSPFLLSLRLESHAPTPPQDFMKQFEPVRKSGRNGAFITSCICHGCAWYNQTSLNVDGKSPYRAYARWMAGLDSGDSAFTIDPRGPNGDGHVQDSRCSTWTPAKTML